MVIRAGSAADAAQIAAVQREGWFAAYEGIISREIIDRVTAPDDGARVRQSYRTRPWQKIIVAEAGEQDAPRSPGAGGLRVPAGPGIVGYASFGPETNVLTEPWPHPLTEAGRDGQIAELYALYVHPAWWSAGTGRALMMADRMLVSRMNISRTGVVHGPARVEGVRGHRRRQTARSGRECAHRDCAPAP